MLLARFLPLLLAGCGEQPADNGLATAPATNATVAVPQPEPPKIPCAPRGVAVLTPICTVDRSETPAGVILTLRHPDGAFHRLQITRDGRGVIAADGAESAHVTLLGADRIEVELGGARYRLPATIRR
ncbi:hypothetical protein [Sphingomonas gei]|uniref:hypothetical protein n=1 Tax=Sphingomonas gei TaxID=1395960 RepID=UPI0019CFB8A7|nr:hypothetical protein [Sphingomonas gei]